MKNLSRYLVIVVFILSLAACSKNEAEPNKLVTSTPAPPAPTSEPAPDAAKAKAPETTIPTGTKLHVVLVDGLSTSRNKVGDRFTASLAAPLVIDGNTILDKNTKLKGRVTDLAGSGRVKGRASIRLVLTDIVYQGADVSISTKPFVAVAQGTKKRDAAIIGGGTGLGALIGGVAGGGKGALIGAAVGAGAGTGTVLATKGKELSYPPETKMSFTLAKDILL
jgi:hypothetical protein